MTPRRWILPAALLLSACDSRPPPAARGPAEAPPAPEITASKAPSPVTVAPHPGIQAARALVDDIRAGKYAQTIYRFSSDEEFAAPRRTAAFRALADYVASRAWTVELASITYANGGLEDSVDVWLTAPGGAWVVLYVGHHHDTPEWRVDGYEFPKQTFNKKGLTLDAYVAKSKEQLRSLPPSSLHKDDQDGPFRLVPPAP
jgi:hypothetical protein